MSTPEPTTDRAAEIAALAQQLYDDARTPALLPVSFNLSVYVMRDGNPDHWVGGADSLANAITLAAAWYQAAQNLYPIQGAGVAVLNNSGVIQAYVGWEKKPPGTSPP